jgi:hypothetical protein
VIFESPLRLFGLLLLPLIVLIEAWITRRDRDRMARLVARPLWPRVLRRPPEYWRPARLVLLLIGAAGIIVALARPQWGIVREKVEREGVDVVLVLDSSGSMATEDVPPNRFFLARQALAALISRLEGDRFGLVAFEGEAYPLSPLTLDADALGLFLDTMEPGIVPAPGTSLGVGLVKGLDLFVTRRGATRSWCWSRTARISKATWTRRSSARRRRAWWCTPSESAARPDSRCRISTPMDGRSDSSTMSRDTGRVAPQHVDARGDCAGHRWAGLPADTQRSQPLGAGIGDRRHGAEVAGARVLVPPQGALSDSPRRGTRGHRLRPAAAAAAAPPPCERRQRP